MDKFSPYVNLDDGIHLARGTYFFNLGELSQRPYFTCRFFIGRDMVAISYIGNLRSLSEWKD